MTLQIVLIVLFAFVIGFAVLARRLDIPYPIVMVIGGLFVGFLPGIPKFTLNPELVFAVFLPPLLYSAAWQTSWREFRYHLVSILLLAFGLVAFTVFAIAAIAPTLFSGFDWHTGFVLGAAVATTDAIAATAIARRVGLPRRIVDIIEGESLVNDASGLLMLEFGVLMLTTGVTPTFAFGLQRLAFLVAGGLGVGLLVAVVIYWLELHIDDGPVEITISLLTPYVAYFAAEAIHASGVLAVVVAGLFLARRSARFFSPGVRIEANAVWGSLTFLLNGVLFVLIGLQWPQVVAGIEGTPLNALVIGGVVFGALVIALRMIWIFPGAVLANIIRTRVLHQDEKMPAMRAVFVAGWSGMRGVIALAAAMSLPHSIPLRNQIVFLTFAAIFITLVVQGLTLPGIVRLVGLSARNVTHVEEDEARRLIAEAAIDHLEQLREKGMVYGDIYEDLRSHYSTRLAAQLGEGGDEHGSSREHAAQQRRVSLDLTQIERETAVRLRDEGKIGDELLRELQQEADLEELRLSAEANRA